MEHRSFVAFNVVGALAWTVGITTAGHFLGPIAVVRGHIELAVLAVVLVSLMPVVFEAIRHRRAAHAARATS